MTDTERIPEDQLFITQMISMYDNSVYDDPRVRTYLALAMGQTGNILFGDVLLKGLDDKGLENRIAAIKSLGSIGYKPSVKRLNSIVASKSSTQERLAAIISLGQIKDKSSITLLEKSLNDEEPNIRWDAAISLTKMNSKKGFSILEKLLTRSYYSNYPNVDENEVNNSILTILALVSKYYSENFKDELVELSQDDKNIKIREFSMRILSEHY